MEPELVSGIVEINPFTKTQKISLGGLLRIRRYRQGMTRLLGTQLLKNLGLWMRYLDVAYPAKPADYASTWPRCRPSCVSPAGWPSS